jgi:hypothetical protein
MCLDLLLVLGFDLLDDVLLLSVELLVHPHIGFLLDFDHVLHHVAHLLRFLDLVSLHLYLFLDLFLLQLSQLLELLALPS